MRKLTTIICLTIAVLLGSAGESGSAGFQKGFDAFKSGDYATALREWEPLAVLGDAAAQSNLGVMYREGKGVPKDDKAAVKWFTLATEQGNAGARKGLNMFRKVDVPVFGIIENMSYFSCPHCGERSEIFAHGGTRSEAGRLGYDFLGEIPLGIDIRTTSDGGEPIGVSQPDGEHAKSYKATAEEVASKISATLAQREADAPRIVVQ